MDRLLVRILPIVLNLYVIVVTAFAWNGVDISVYDYWFSSPITLGLIFTVLCHSQGKYHCKWIRFLCYNLIFVPLVSFFDAINPIFYEAESMITFICVDMLVTIVATVILAINHFRRVRKVINKHRHE